MAVVPPYWRGLRLLLASYGMAWLGLALLLGGGLVVWALVGRDFVMLDNRLAGLGIGAVVVAMWWLSNRSAMPVAEHPETLQGFVAANSGRAEGAELPAPLAFTTLDG